MSYINSLRKKLIITISLILFTSNLSVNYAQQASDKTQPVNVNSGEKSFPIYKIGSHIFVKAKLNDDERYWMIDTGASGNAIDSAYAEKFKLRGHYLADVFEISGEAKKMTAYKIPLLILNNTRMEDINASGMDVSGLFKKTYNIEVVGILGNEFFMKYAVKIDYDNLIMTFYDPAQFKYQGSGNKVKFVFFNYTIHVPLKFDNKFKGLFILDTGSGSSSFNYPFALKNKITEMDGPDLKSFSTLGSRISKFVRLPKVEFGAYILENVTFNYPAENPKKGLLSDKDLGGLIGNNILQNFIFYIDYKNNAVYLEKGKNFNQELPSSKCGMQYVVNKDNLYEIIHISKKSAAERAGLKVGDIVMAINGKNPSDSLSLEDIRSIFTDKEGTKIELIIMRESKEHKITLILMDPYKK